MNLRIAILVLSLAGNIVLAAFVSRHHEAIALSPERSAEPQKDSTATVVTPGKSSNVENVPKAATEPNPTGNTFHWSQLEADDYKKYIAALRAFGVPERTIRDIIIADVNKLYRPKFAALRPPKKTEKEKNEKFWERNRNWYGSNQDMTKEQRVQMAALQKEQTELIKELLGKDVYQEISKDSGYPDRNEQIFGKLSDEQRAKVSEMQQRFGEITSEIYSKAEGYIDQDTQAELKKARKKLRDELGTVLSPEQVEEYELRSSDTAQQMKWQLSYFEPDEKEFRAIFKYKQAQEGMSSPRDSSDEDAPKITAEERKVLADKRKQLTEEFEKTLDPDRLKEYKLQEDYAYRNLFEAGVPKENVFKVADMRKQTEEAVKKIRLDKTMTPDQRTEALKAVRTETEAELTTLLGTRRAKAYRGNGGWWLQNISPNPQ